MRMTVHLLPADDAGWMLPLFEPIQERWSRRRLAQLGLPEDRHEKVLRAVKKALADGPLTRGEMTDAVEAAGIELDQQTRLHMVMLATVSGLAIQGPDFGAKPSLVLRRDWLGEPRRLERDAALAELARRYLRAFGPATERDFARWAGLPLRDVRAGLTAIASELEEERDRRRRPWSRSRRQVAAAQARAAADARAPSTPTCSATTGASFSSPDHHERINPLRGGMIEPAIVRDGELLGVWKLSRAGGETRDHARPPCTARRRRPGRDRRRDRGHRPVRGQAGKAPLVGGGYHPAPPNHTGENQNR